ncbi:MAG: cryptochrome/photolyase family protein [bacterium]|jgi:deoxyribodipyrimidine photo-lyase|nr:DNA photolyase family protein [Betaproteobacteria bacterium]
MTEKTRDGTRDSALCWFRRDLRTGDNAALSAALAAARRVWCVFVFDRAILDRLPSKADRRVEFIRESLLELDARLAAAGGGVIVCHDDARRAIPALATRLQVQAVFAGHDYEPDAIERDRAVGEALAAAGIAFETRKDQVVFERREVLTGSGTVFGVFTPYKNAWLKKLAESGARELSECPFAPAPGQLQPPPAGERRPADWTLESIGFERSNLAALDIPTGESGARSLLEAFLQRIDGYHERRDFPAVKGPSYLSVHLRFGTVSIRELARLAHAKASASEGARVWLSELVWRDFYFMILSQHPHVVGGSWKREYDRLAFADDPALFAAWCEARTGYPIVDAAMRQINQTGYMHNRLRMVVASFLVKDLLVDWRQGERYFADHLNDFDLSANNGGWQWAASTGCDAQPYFRIFNPVSQSERFDADGKFIRRYLPELAKVPAKYIHAPWTMPALEQKMAGCMVGTDYPAPVVDHAVQRVKALAMYKAVKG